MFVGAEEAGEVNQGELINPVVAVRLEDGVVWHVDYELENQHNTVLNAFKSLRFCGIYVGVTFDEVRGVAHSALKECTE